MEAIADGLQVADLNEEPNVTVEGAERAPALIDAAQRIEVNSQTTLETATDIGGQIHALISKIEEQRKGLVGPFNDYVGRINKLFKAVREPLHVQKDALKRKIAAYEERQEIIARERAAAEQKAQEEAAGEQNLRPPPAPAATPHRQGPIRGAYGTTASVSKRWEFEVVDKARVPLRFLTLDEKAVRAAIAEGERDIPGLRIFQRRGVSFG